MYVVAECKNKTSDELSVAICSDNENERFLG